MRFLTAALLLSAFASAACYGQTVPQSELIRRIELNRSFFSDWDNWPNLRTQVDQTGQDVSLIPNVMESPLACNKCVPADPTNDPGVKLAAQLSNIVVVGHVTMNISALTKKESFIVTDSEFIVDEVWKDSSQSMGSTSLIDGTEITVVTPGGVVRSDGHTIRASMPNRESLREGGRYLLFLKYIPSSNSYYPVGFYGFDVTQGHVEALHKTLPPPAASLIANTSIFMQAMHSSVARAIAVDGK
jgi:hypothetical protein